MQISLALFISKTNIHIFTSLSPGYNSAGVYFIKANYVRITSMFVLDPSCKQTEQLGS